MKTALLCITLLLTGCQFSDQPSGFKLYVQHAKDSIELRQQNDALHALIESPGGIGTGSITRKTDPWPKNITLRFHLRDLEGFRIHNGTDEITGFLGNPDPDALRIEKTGKWIEVTVPAELLEPNPSWISFHWVDFYRH